MSDTTVKLTAACCADCGVPYADDGFADLIVPDDAWALIAPDGTGNGLLCPTCLVRRALRAGLKCRATFRSGPFADHEPPAAAAPDQVWISQPDGSMKRFRLDGGDDAG